MKYGKLMIFGALLASCVPSAMATLLTGSISTSGSGRLTATSIAFTIPASNPNPGGGHYDQSPGNVVAPSSGGFAQFTNAATMYYVTGATSTVTRNGKYTLRSAAKLTYASATVATPQLLEQIVQNGITLDVFITHVYTPVTLGVARAVNSHGVVTNPGAQGAFVADAYVTETGNPDQTPGIFFLTNNAPGTGVQAFSTEFLSTVAPVPEPASIALLGTGMLGAAGLMFRKRRTA